MYTEDYWYNVWQEIKYFRAAKIFLIICAVLALAPTITEIVKKRLELKRFAAGAAVCVLTYAVGGGLYAFFRGISGISVFAWCAVIFAVSCVLLAVFGKLCSSGGEMSFFLGMTTFSVIAGTVFSLLLIDSLLVCRDPSEIEIPLLCWTPLLYFYELSANCADFIAPAAVKIIFMAFVFLSAGKLKESEKLRKFVPAVFAVSAAVCCLGSGLFFRILNEFTLYTKGLYMAAFGLAVICALLPFAAFIFGKVRRELEIKLFLKGLAIQAAAYICGFVLYQLIDHIMYSSEIVFDTTPFGFTFIIMIIGISFALYRAAFCECSDEKKALSVFLGILGSILPVLVIFMVMFYYDEVRDQYQQRTEYVGRAYINNIYYIRFMIVAVLLIIAESASAFKVKRIHSSERMSGKAEYISSAMAVGLYCLTFCSYIALYI